MGRKFKMIDEDFQCIVCDYKVKKLNYTARNHCPNCLCSIHIDNNPGDRECYCKGILRPIGIETSKKGYKIVHKCEICNEIKRNVAAMDDNMELIIKLSSNPVMWKEKV